MFTVTPDRATCSRPHAKIETKRTAAHRRRTDVGRKPFSARALARRRIRATTRIFLSRQNRALFIFPVSLLPPCVQIHQSFNRIVLREGRAYEYRFNDTHNTPVQPPLVGLFAMVFFLSA